MSNYLQIRQRRRLLPILLFLMSLSTSLSAFARDFEYQGVNYTVIDETAKTCMTKAGKYYSMWGWESGSSVSGVLELPQEAYDGSSWYKLIEISSYSFYECGKLQSVIIPEGVVNIGNNAFNQCVNLVTVKLPDTLEKIEDKAFYECSKLESINFTPNLVSIGSFAFCDCVSLSSLNVPSSVKTIYNAAFYDCSGLGTIVVEGNATIGSSAFKGCTLRPLSLKGKIEMGNGALDGLNSNSYIICRQTVQEEIKNIFSGSVYSFDIPYSVTSLTPLFCGFKINLEKNPYYFGDINKIKLIADVINSKTGRKEVENMEINPNNEIFVKDLKPDTNYKIKFSWTPEQEDYASESIHKFKTSIPKVICNYSATQTTITINSVSAEQDESISPSIYVYDSDKKEYIVYSGGEHKIKGLYPGDYFQKVYADYNGTSVYGNVQYTKSIEMHISVVKGATSVSLTGSYEKGDADVEYSGWEKGVYQSSHGGWWKWVKLAEGDKVELYSLAPDSNYKYRYIIKVKGAKEDFLVEESVYLPALEMEMLKPKCVSSTNAIVAAKTNIADDEPSVGFQWKKYDAPATMEPNEAYAVVCDGMLEGYIRNLQTTSFYNVRAFYKDAEGNYYYSDWTTFDPSDFSYFEPTVRTYPVEEVSSSTATVRGYALPGTDNIKSQGFQYWRSGGAAEAVAFAPASTEIVTVPVSGQVMTTTFENLDESTTYVYRAYAETDAGFTYGEEMSFTTESASGVSTLWPDSDKAEAPTIVCYYNLQGQRFSQPQPGLNIVLYSDGTTRKIMTRR